MKVDIYKRSEPQGSFAYLAVPEGKPIPEEATAVDWETVEHNIDLDPDNEPPMLGLSGEDALAQIGAKGYAISSARNKVPMSPNT